MIKRYFDMIAGIFRASPDEHWHMLKQDSRYALRVMRRNPGFTAIAVVTLALGVGVNTAIFSVLNGIILRPLPYKDAGQIVIVQQQLVKTGIGRMDFSVAEMSDYRQQNTTLNGLVEYHNMRFVLQGNGTGERVRTGVVSYGFFDFFGVEPVLGRSFVASEEQTGAAPVVLLSYEYWQRKYGGDRGVVGKTLRINDRLHTVIGVLPSLPQYPDDNDVYITTTSCPFRMWPDRITNRNRRFSRAFARLKPGVSLQQATNDMGLIASRLQREHPDSYKQESGYRAFVLPLKQELTSKARPVLWVLLAAAGFVLLIACANVANYTLARLSQREQELTLRSALGADRSRLLRQLFTESLWLGLVAALLGLVLALATHKLLVEFVTRLTPRARDISIDGWVLLFAVIAAVLTSVVTGSLLGFSSKYQAGAAGMKDVARQTTAGIGQKRVRNTLIIAQVAFSLALLVGAGLMLRSFIKLQQVDPGFVAEKVLTMALDLNENKYPAPADQLTAGHAILDKVQSVPGVVSAAVSSTFPLDPDALALGINATARNTSRVQIEGRPVEPGQLLPLVPYKQASPDYFKTLGIPLLQGRTFQDTDKQGAPGVAVVNQAFVQHRLGLDQPLGKKISWDGGKTWLIIVGVVGNTKEFSLKENLSDEVYYPIDQNPGLGSLLIRTTVEPMTLVNQVRKAIDEAAPETAISYVVSLEQARDDTLTSPRVITSLLGLFAALALVVAASGIGGILALSVSQRVKEIGIRVALGAQPSDVLHMVVRQGMLLVAAGLAFGLVAAFALIGPLKTFLFQVAPADPFTLAGVCGLLALAALVACYIPAWQATRITPIVALRHE
jgi:putative ABC transport system permease protein